MITDRFEDRLNETDDRIKDATTTDNPSFGRFIRSGLKKFRRQRFEHLRKLMLQRRG